MISQTQSHSAPSGAKNLEVPVLIVGGGGAGLTASMLLSQLGVEHLLVSALPTTSILPKAHVLNQKTMEILTDVGVAEEIYEKSTPAENMRAMGWYAGLAGPDPDFGRRIAQIESWGDGYTNLNWVAASPCRSSNLPQIRLEPIFKARAEALNPGGVRFHHELIELAQDADGVTSRIRNLDDGAEYTVRSKYLIGCDGGRTIAKQVGIEHGGLGVVAQSGTVHISADLSHIARDPHVLIRWIWCPAIGRMAVLVPMGPTRWGPDSEEWVFHLAYQGDELRGLSDEKVEADMRLALGLENVPLTIHKLTRWTLEGVLADKFRVGRVFIAGDAAHRHPPTGGLGLTSAVQDVHNLCWKLAAVLAGQAGESLLDTYEPERRPTDARNIQRSLENSKAHMETGPAFGLDPKRRDRSQLGADEAHLERQARGRRAPQHGIARDPAPDDGEQRAQRRVRLPVRLRGGRSRRFARAAADRRHPSLRAEHASGQSAAACVDRRRGWSAPAAQGSRRAGAFPVDRRRGRRRLVRCYKADRRRQSVGARLCAHRRARRRPLRSTARLGAVPGHQPQRRGTRAPRPLRRLALARRRRQSCRRPGGCLAADPGQEDRRILTRRRCRPPEATDTPLGGSERSQRGADHASLAALRQAPSGGTSPGSNVLILELADGDP